MLFNSPEFIFYFLPITLVVFFVISRFKQNFLAILWLVITSLFFYGYWNFKYLILILSSMVFNYYCGVVLSKFNSQQQRRLILIIGLVLNISLLIYFKYANLFLETINNIVKTNFNLGTIILPLGISFFTFQQITYLVDVYLKKITPDNFVYYCLFVTFFPHLIAGPITHYKEIVPQFYDKKIYKLKFDNLVIGITVFSIGLCKKVFLADNISIYANPLFDAVEKGLDLTLVEAWCGVLAYTFQLYFDFSGYSDMAIGLGKMFGIKLPLNFYSPYKSINIIEFWRRWHISLSRFLRDYLYIPLGGSRKGELRRYVNLMTTMLLGGLWHGAGWNFVLWGGLHGFYLIINHGWHNLLKYLGYDPQKTKWWLNILAWLITFLAVIISWVFFRAKTLQGAIKIVMTMFGFNGLSLPSYLINTENNLTSWLIQHGVKIYGTFDHNIIVSATDIGRQQELILLLVVMFIIVCFFPNTQELLKFYKPALSSDEFNFKSKWQFNFTWEFNILWGLILGLMWSLILLNSFNAAPSQFLYFQF